MTRRISTFLLALLLLHESIAQNLPSLLLNKNINATFSIIAYDAAQQEWGIAVATNNIYVGNSTIYIEPGIGAFSVIAETEPSYAHNGFGQLKKGQSIKNAIEFTRQKDEERHMRQVSGIDKDGNVYAFTGESLKYWQGTSTHRIGKGYVVMGNQLADKVLDSMAISFEKSVGTLAERLLKSLMAGQNAGGQINGKQSAALVVKGANNEWFNQIDLRVDHSVTPFDDLQKLLNYHYGRIRINQAINAIRKQKPKGEALLQQAEKMVEGWNGIYGKLAVVYILLNNEPKAVSIIQKALKENPQWRENLPAFYCLRKHKAIADQLLENTFTLAQWTSAIGMMLQLNKTEEAIALANKVLVQNPSASFVHFQLAQAYQRSNNKALAKTHAEKALALDTDNVEAKEFLAGLGK